MKPDNVGVGYDKIIKFIDYAGFTEYGGLTYGTRAFFYPQKLKDIIATEWDDIWSTLVTIMILESRLNANEFFNPENLKFVINNKKKEEFFEMIMFYLKNSVILLYFKDLYN